MEQYQSTTRQVSDPFLPRYQEDEKSALVVAARARTQNPALLWAALLLVAFLTFALRATYLDRSYDIFVDEITYLHISEQVADHNTVRLYGETFHLHPPAFFLMEGTFLKVFQPQGNRIERIYAARYLNVALATITAVFLFLIARRIGGWVAGFVVAALFALDPFIIRMNSRNLLDISAMMWVVAGYWVLLSGLRETRPRLEPWRLALTGLLFGLATLTKDMMAFLTLLPMLFFFVTRWVLPRRHSLVIGTITLLTYLLYPLTTWAVGDWERFSNQKFRGVMRLAGFMKETGMNREGGPSFIDTLIAKMGTFGMTYILIALGAVALLLLLKQGGREKRLVAVWAGSAYALLGYCIVLGTLEEQFFYYLVLPAALVTGLALLSLFHLPWFWGTRRGALYGVTATMGILFLLWGGYQWHRTHFTPDNGYETVRRYLEENVPPDSDVAATSETAQFLLGEYSSGPWGSWETVGQMRVHRPDYLLVSARQVEWDYGERARPLLDWVEQNGTPVLIFEGESNGLLILYRLPEVW